MVTKKQLLRKANQLGKASIRYHNHHTEFMGMLKDFIDVDDLPNSFSDSFIDCIEQTGCESVTIDELDIWINEFKTCRV